ncbi:hypothetical protein ACFSKI_10010 [Pseudogracilibacillus auburnensis]|uniref:Uncharacterized protein n=1 Tax=Pseudogracilibacillus auburnensis TaxID=1494959 RepID=A0A2V3VV59_9BACI|nr:hypothetical protein [Pseudogracilibacillus auburnensis]PXW85853.1 hypothetical protein DFR56_10915 [Pseudogracilibacillus auburnensis]
MITASKKLKLLTLATKYGVEVENFFPGNIVISIAAWDRYETKIIQLMEDLKSDPHIKNIIWDQGVVNIHYVEHALDDKKIINDWLRIFEKYSF